MDRRADGDRPLASVGTPSRPLSVGWSATSPDDARSLAASHVSADTEALLAQQADMFSVRTLLQPSARQRSAATTRRPREAAPGRARSLLQAAGPRGGGRPRERERVFAEAAAAPQASALPVARQRQSECAARGPVGARCAHQGALRTPIGHHSARNRVPQLRRSPALGSLSGSRPPWQPRARASPTPRMQLKP